jgi:SAM-dependent methyltransferase
MYPNEDALRIWQEWQNSIPGESLIESEFETIERLGSSLYGRLLVQMGRYGHDSLRPRLVGIRRYLLIDSFGSLSPSIVTHADGLAIATDSVNVVYMPHTLELVRDPHAVLREADRILIPDGRLVISVFNSFSLHGLWLLFAKGRYPWAYRFFSRHRLQDWLSLLGFEVEKIESLCFRPPLRSKTLFHKLSIMETMGARYWPMASGVFVIVAVKRTIPLNPLTIPWRSQKAFMPGRIAEPSARIDSGV